MHQHYSSTTQTINYWQNAKINTSVLKSNLNFIRIAFLFFITIAFSYQNAFGQCSAYFEATQDSAEYKTYHFKDMSTSNSKIIDWSWDFGDGAISNLQNPDHTYLICAGVYVNLTITDSLGCFANHSFYVNDPPLTINYSIVPDPANFKTIHFNDQSGLKSKDLTYTWDFRDGDSSTLQSPVHTYAFCYNFNPSIVIIDALTGCSTANSLGVNVAHDLSASVTIDSTDQSLVSFKGSSSTNPAVWNWDFGDGTTSNLQNVSHKYANCGEYYSTLSVSDSNGSCANYTSNYIKIGSLSSYFSYTIDSAGFKTMHFTDYSSSNDTVNSWTWDFGDGTSSTLQNPSHTYDSCKYYYPSLTVTDKKGCKLTYSSYLYPYNSISFTSTQDIVDFKKFQFDATSAYPIPYWNWDFGDGETSKAQNPSHIYSACGSYYVYLLGTDSAGCTSEAGNYVDVGGIYAYFGFTNSGKQITFTDYSTSPNQINSWLWDFGDGTTSTLQNPIHVFSNCDNYYNVTLTVTDSVSCSIQTANTVYIGGSYASFYTTIDSTNTTYFYDQSSSYNTITSYKWTFGDGSSSTVQNPTHSYTACNDHVATLIVTDNIGCKDTMINTIYKPTVQPSFGMGIDYSTSYKTVMFSNYSCCDITSHLWIFGDGTTSTTANPVYTYADFGIYTVCLVESKGACKDTMCQQITLTANYDCYASMGYYKDDKSSLIIHFEDYSYSGSGTISKRTWDFGDGTTSTQQNPVHTYSSCGSYNVTLTIQDPTGCFSTTTNYVYVGSDPYFYYNQDTSNYRTFSFYLGEVPKKLKTINWEFSDGSVSNQLSPIHTFTYCDTNNNNYLYLPVKVTLTDSSGCVTSTTNWVYISLYPNIVITQDTNNYSVQNFTANYWNSINTAGFTWNWMFGDGESSSAQNTSHVYTKCGSYYGMLHIYDNIGCESKFDFSVNIAPDISATYAFDDTNPNLIHFFGSSSSSVQNWSWDFDNGAFTSTLQNPTYTRALKCGDYVNANVSISDSSACSASTSVGIDLNLYSYFWYTNDMYDSKKISFTSNADGNPTVFNWDFGDGVTSNLANPVHQYANSGQYYVCMQTFNAAACSSNYCSYVYIYCQNNTDFAFTQDTGNIYNFKFTDASTGDRTNWFWDFGDGNYSYEKNPSHTYDYSGYFYTCLTVYDSLGGCQSSNCYYIEIYDPNIVTCAAYFYSDTDTVNPNLILFTNASLGDMTNWYWDFGDGNSSDKANPRNVYNTPGYYNVCLYGWDSVSWCQNYYCASIKVGDDSTVCYTYADYTTFPLGGNTISLNNKSSDYSYSYWDFGDGNSSYEANPTYTYTYGGYYNICLTVYNGFYNCMDYECKYIKVGNDSSNCYTFANFSQFPDASGNGVYFENYSAGYTNVYWDFGDGNYSYDNSAYNLYADAGYYNVCLYVSDYNTGCQEYLCKYIKVGTDSTVCYSYSSFYSIPDTTGSGVSFRNTSAGYSSSYWDFGDGNVSYENDPYHIYPAGGYYYACLSIYDDSTGCYEYACDYVKAGRVDSNDNSCYVHANYSYFPDSIGNGMSFSNLSIGHTGLYWDFGDYTYSIDENPYHEFSEAGYYYVCLNAYDSITSCANNWCMYIKVGEDDSVRCPAIAQFATIADATGYGVKFKNNSSGYNSVYWDFGDGDYSSKVEPYHVYADGGYYQVCLSITNDSSNCTEYVCRNIKAGADSNSCSVNADFSNIPVSNSTSVNFSNKSTGYTDIFWEFGDGDFSTNENPYHAYSAEGIYSVCITAMYLGTDTCIQTSCKNIIVTLTDTSTVAGCLADFIVVVDSATLTATFTDNSLGNPDYWYWNFNDFTVSSSDQNPVHTFTDDGYYEVCLTIYKGSDCKNTYCKVIAVGDVSNDVFANFNYMADSLTSTAFFKDKSFGAITSWNWDFGDNQGSSFENPAHTYPDTGSYLACLTIKNANNVKGTKCKNIRIGNTLANACKFSCVWPGDANYSLESNHYDLLAIGFNYGLTGPIRDSVSNRWIGHYGTNWSTQMPNGINNKHSDCNGDGIVDLSDLDAINQNFAYSHPYQPGKTGKSYNSANPDLYFELTDGQDIAPGSTVEVSVMAGRDTTSLYGIAFEFNFDKSFVKANSFATAYDNTWLGNKTTELITYDKTDYNLGQTFVGMTRFDKAGQDGMGNIATFTFTVDSSFTNNDELVICVNTDYGMDANGDTVTFNSDFCDTLKTAGINPGFENIVKIENINLYPNPTKGTVSFKLPYISEGIYEIELTNTLGQDVYKKVLNSGGYQQLDLSKLESGLYFVNIKSTNNFYTQKLNIISR